MSQKESDWCQEEDLDVAWCKFNKVIIDNTHPKRVRCSQCGKRFITFVRECHDAGCYHAYLPKHKKPVKRKKKISRDTCIKK